MSISTWGDTRMSECEGRESYGMLADLHGLGREALTSRHQCKDAYRA